MRAATADRTTYVITTKNAPRAGLPAPAAAKSEHHPDAGAESDQESAESAVADELVLNESLEILRDYVQLLKANAPASVGSAKAR